jgi:hypothetical protein
MLTVASPGIFVVLAACALGIGFMVRFLVAIARDKNQIRVGHPGRAREVRSHAAVNPAGHLAMGVVRITTALASNAREHAAAERPHLITYSARSREREAAAVRRYS